MYLAWGDHLLTQTKRYWRSISLLFCFGLSFCLYKTSSLTLCTQLTSTDEGQLFKCFFFFQVAFQRARCTNRSRFERVFRSLLLWFRLILPVKFCCSVRRRLRVDGKGPVKDALRPPPRQTHVYLHLSIGEAAGGFVCLESEVNWDVSC